MLWSLLVSAALLAPTPGGAPVLEPTESAASEIVLDAVVDTNDVLLGDRLKLVVTARHPKTIRLYFPAAPDVSPFRLIGSPSSATQKIEGDEIVETWHITLTALRVGLRKIPPISIDYETADGLSGVVQTPTVNAIISGRIQPGQRDIAVESNTAPMPVLDTNWWLIMSLIGLGIVIVTAVLTWFAVRYVAGLPKRGPPPPLPRPAHEIANEKLQHLSTDGLLQAGQFKDVAIRLSEILREYLGLRFHTDTLELTSSELLTEMQTLSPKGLSTYRLEQFLQDTDMVKFARFAPTHDQMSSDWSACTEIIEATRRSDQEVMMHRQAEEQRRRLEKPAHPFKRTFAVLCDLLFFSIVSTTLILIGRAFDMSWLFWLDGLLFVAFLLGRDIPTQGSPGKVLTGLAVTPADDPRSALLSTGSRILRNITLLVPVIGYTMEFVVMAYAADGRRVGDRWAKSRVLDLRPDSSSHPFLLLGLAALVFTIIIGYMIPFYWVVL